MMAVVPDSVAVADLDEFVRDVEHDEFCADQHDPADPLPPWPYNEDGYCCWCGNGSWKSHAPWCTWADAIDAVSWLLMWRSD